MKNSRTINLFLLLMLVLITCLAFVSKKKYKVSGIVTETSEPCGGVRPPQGLEEQLRAPQALINKKILIKKGSVNTQQNKIIAEVITNKEGRFNIELPAGTYLFISEEKEKFTIPANDKFNTYDVDCLKKQFATPDGLLKVKSGENKIEINFHKPCFYKKPCVTYSGPMPQ